VVENADLIPKDGRPCIVCANHSNSLTDAVLLVGSVPYKNRNFLRLTAKDTQFGKPTFSSWLIESAGTVPVQRRKEHPDAVELDNADAMETLKRVLEDGHAVCLFPEGGSRYHPTIAPLKTGAARLIADVLTRNKDKPDFEISLLTCSITYMHREHFRSDVLITFHAPMTFTPKTNPELIHPVDFSQIRSVTAQMQVQIGQGTIDAPSWDIVRSAKTATKIYVPLGTNMSLGDYVRVCRTFVEVFKWAQSHANGMKGIMSGSDEEDEVTKKQRYEQVNELRAGLKKYQDNLSRLGIKDDRIRVPLSRLKIIYRILVRFSWMTCLAFIALPGLILWAPVFATTRYAVKRFTKSGPVWDTYDEIAQTKLVYGLASGFVVWAVCILTMPPLAPITAVAVPAIMWMSLRWYEDAVSASRALMGLIRLLRMDSKTTKEMRERREYLRSQLMTLATNYLRLPEDPERFFLESGGKEKGRVRGAWESRVKYFSVRRRRKRDWDETLRLYDLVDYPEDPGLE